MTAGHAEYVQPAVATVDSEGSTVSALAEGDGDE